MALDLRRGTSSKKLLQVAWTYPVHKPAAAPEPTARNATVAAPVEGALPAAEAWQLVADGDQRPLLVLRECELCKGTDHALLNRSLDNEQTVLLTGWFRCVKLPPNVLDEKHPLHALFARSKEGEPIPHLFFADNDGGNRTPLPGDQTQAQLWDVMFRFLDRAYTGDAKKAVKELRALLSDFDTLDALEQDVKVKLDKETERSGNEARIQKLERDLADLGKRRDKLRAREQELRAMALRPKAAADAPAAGEAPRK